MYLFPIPINGSSFEQLVCDLLSQEEPSFNQWGRNGQKQSGFDIYSASEGIVVECKWKDFNRRPKVLYNELKADIERHVSLVKDFKGFKVKKLIIVTTLKEDTKIQELAALSTNDFFTVEVWGWKKVERMLNNHTQLIKKYCLNFAFDPSHKKRFTTHRSISESHFSSSHGNIFLSAYLPCLRNGGKGSCAISFKSNNLSMVTLTNDDILNFERRRNMSIDECICLGQIKEVNNRWFINIKSSAFYISEPDKNELCSILDDFLNEYQKAFTNYKKVLGAGKFEMTVAGDVKLMTVSKDLWRQMMIFSHEFDFDRGKSEWHIFSENRLSIIVQRSGCVIYNTWLTMERSGSIFSDFLQDTETIDVVWRIPGLTEFNKPGVWKASTTYWWLANEFIPKVLDYYRPKPKDRLFKRSLKLFNQLFYKHLREYLPRTLSGKMLFNII